MDLIKHSQLLPDKPTAADTADWYRLGDSVEKHGRHMKRQAVAAEYNSGRNMEAWYREVSLTSDAGVALLSEAKKLDLIPSAGRSSTPELSQALPTRHAALEYAKAEPEVREVIKEQITLNGKTYTAKEIKALTDELSTEAMEGRIAANDRDKLRSQLDAVSQDTTTKDLESARKELDALFTSILTVSRNITNLSTNAFTHNDPEFITRIGQQLEALTTDYCYRSDQITASSSNTTSSYSSGTAGSEVRVLDVTHSY